MSLITESLLSWITDLERDWITYNNERKEKAYKNTINFINNIILQTPTFGKDMLIKTGTYLNNHQSIFPWVIPIIIIGNKFILPFQEFPIFIEILGPFMSNFDLLQNLVPSVKIICQNNVWLSQNIDLHCITPEAWKHIINSTEWKEAVNNHNNVIIAIGVFTVIVIIKSTIL